MPPDEHSASTTLTQGSSSAAWRLVSLAAIAALAAFLRLWQTGESLWIDELHTSWVVSSTLGDVLPRAAMGNQSPLYFWGMWLLVQVMGQSEWTLRLPSLVAGIALPAAVYYLVGQVSNVTHGTPSVPTTIAGLAAALLVAIDPTCIFYAQEARPYAWVMLLAVVELVLLKRLIERPTIGWRMALVANSLALFYLHYTTAIFLGGVVVMLPMLVRVTGTTYPARYLVLDLLLAAALTAPGVIQMTDIFERRTNWEAFVNKPLWQQLFTEVPFVIWAMAGIVVVLVFTLAPRVLSGNALTKGSASSAPPSTLQSSLLWYTVLLASILLPLVLSWSITALDAARVFYIRYLVALVPLAAVAACLATLWIPWRAVQLTALVALAGWHLNEGQMLKQFTRDGRLLAARNEDWRGAIAYLSEVVHREPTSKVALDPDLIESSGGFAFDETKEYELFALHGAYEAKIEDSKFVKMPPVRRYRYRIQHVLTLWEAFYRGGRPTTVFVIVRGNTERAHKRCSNIDDIWHSILDTDPRPVFHSGTARSFGRVHVIQIDVEYEPNPDALLKWESRDSSSD